MSKIISGLVILASLHLVSGERGITKTADCKKRLVKADECLRKIIKIGDWNSTFISSPEDLNAHCKLTKEKLRCVQNYQRCLGDFPKQVFNILYQNARMMYKERCDDPMGRAEFLKHNKCFDENASIVHICIDKLIKIFQYLAKNVSGDRDEMLSSTCCAVHRGVECFTTKLKKLCNKKTGAKTDVYFSDKVYGMLGEAFEFTCSEYSTMAACKEKKPELMATFLRITGPESVVRQARTSLLIPLMKIVEKINF